VPNSNDFLIWQGAGPGKVELSIGDKIAFCAGLTGEQLLTAMQMMFSWQLVSTS
jgi:hypothetical protein